MSTDLAKQTTMDAAAIKALIIGGDMSKLDESSKVTYYRSVCDSLGLNPLTQPFSYLRLNNKEILYANRSCTEQLRKINGVSVSQLEGKHVGDLYIVTCHVKDAQGRMDVSTGAVNVKGLQGDPLANAIMKAETKSKRRATLSICGLGFLDESEVETIPPEQIGKPVEQLDSKFAPPKAKTPERTTINAGEWTHLKDTLSQHGIKQRWFLEKCEVAKPTEITLKQYDDAQSRINQIKAQYLQETNPPVIEEEIPISDADEMDHAPAEVNHR